MPDEGYTPEGEGMEFGKALAVASEFATKDEVEQCVSEVLDDYYNPQVAWRFAIILSVLKGIQNGMIPLYFQEIIDAFDEAEGFE